VKMERSTSPDLLATTETINRIIGQVDALLALAGIERPLSISAHIPIRESKLVTIPETTTNPQITVSRYTDEGIMACSISYGLQNEYASKEVSILKGEPPAANIISPIDAYMGDDEDGAEADAPALSEVDAQAVADDLDQLLITLSSTSAT
jgi:hypothetical protein